VADDRLSHILVLRHIVEIATGWCAWNEHLQKVVTFDADATIDCTIQYSSC
jgi:hypothetical protein